MAGSLNRATIIGHLGKDPEIRSLQDGREIANLSVATSESWKDRNGDRQERVEWHRVIIFNENLAAIAKQYLKKGSKVMLEGQIKTRRWEDNAGQEKYSTEIVLQGFDAKLLLLDSRKEASEPRQATATQPARHPSAPLLDDDIPF